jgi:GxxExxY protein
LNRRAAELHEFAQSRMDNRELNRLGGIILDAAITVHKELGAGLLESAYELALARELRLRGIECRTQVVVDLEYKGEALGKSYVMDLLVEDEIVIEIKSSETLHPIYKSQLITYLRLSRKKLGYLINFNTLLLKDGFKRVVHNF